MDALTELGIAVDGTNPEQTIAALERLGDAAERARRELLALGDMKHGGIRIAVVNGLVNVTIKPSKP